MNKRITNELILKAAADLNFEIDENILQIIKMLYMKLNEELVRSDPPKDPPDGWGGC